MVEMPKKLQFWSLEKLKPYERNSREHSPEQIKRIAESMKTFGFTNPILVDGDNGIIAGHGRLSAAKELGLDKVPVIQLEHLTDEQKRAYVIADNKMAELSNWNIETLKSELSELKELNFDLNMTGFQSFEIDSLLNVDLNDVGFDIPDNDKKSGSDEQVPTEGFKQVTLLYKPEEHEEYLQLIKEFRSQHDADSKSTAEIVIEALRMSCSDE